MGMIRRGRKPKISGSEDAMNSEEATSQAEESGDSQGSFSFSAETDSGDAGERPARVVVRKTTRRPPPAHDTRRGRQGSYSEGGSSGYRGRPNNRGGAGGRQPPGMDIHAHEMAVHGMIHNEEPPGWTFMPMRWPFTG